MKILILHASCYPSETRLATFLEQHNYSVLVESIYSNSFVDLLKCDVDVVINRVYSRDVAILPGLFEKTIDLVSAWEKSGTLVINGLQGTHCDLDKFFMYQCLEKNQIPTPCSHKFIGIGELKAQLKHCEPGDYIVKPVCGGCAEYVYKVRSIQELEAIGQYVLDNAEKRHYSFGFIFQPYIKASSPFHYRVQLVGNVFICCHVRHLVATDDQPSWLGSASKGSQIRYLERSEIPDTIIDTSIRAAKACGTLIAGVDILLNTQGEAVVIEVNGTPFLQAVDIHPIENEQWVYQHLLNWIVSKTY